MLFMVIEKFKDGDPKPAGDRFKQSGRMLPDDVIYLASWMEVAGSRCYQVMEAPNREALDAWIARWADLVEFEVVPVKTSAEFWGEKQPVKR